MARSKLNLENSALTWDAKRRYKVNAIASYLGITYQNLTGKNSEPGVGTDWFVPPVLESFPKLQFTADGSQTTFNLGIESLINAVFWNGALLDDVDWYQTSNTLSLTFTPALGDKIKPI